MNLKTPTTLTILLFILMPLMVQAQKIRLYNSDKGLPSSLINRVFQDKRGYIWIATENGVSYFDGMRFTNFYNEHNQPGSISSDLVKIIYTDSRGTCWIGTSNSLQIFDYENNTFRAFPTQCPSFPGPFYVSSILESPDKDKLLVSFSGIGIVVYDIKSHKIDLSTTNKLRSIYSTAYLGNMFMDSEGCLWTFAEQGNFYKLNFKQKKLDKKIWGPDLTELSRKVVVSAIVEDPVTKNLLIGTFNHGLFIYDRSLGYIRRAKGLSSSKYPIRSLLAEKQKGPGSESNIWIGTEWAGLKKFDRKGEDIVKADFQYSPIDLDNCKVHSLLQDNQGNIWVGVFQKGLLIIPKSIYGFEYLKLNENQGAMSENRACVTSVSRDPAGDLWVGTDGGGLFRIAKTGGLTRYAKENTPLPNNAILTLATDKRGTLWMSTYLGGITSYNQNSGFRSFSNELDLQKVFCSVYDSKNDKLYLGTLGHGVKVLSIPEKRIDFFPKSVNTGWINSLCLDASGLLWVGGTNGLSCYDTKTGEERNVNLKKKIGESRIYSFLEDRDGSIWIGTADGLVHYAKDKKDVGLFSKVNGLPSNLVLSIQQDQNGVLWIGTGNGLSRLEPKSRKIKNFYACDGLQDNEFRMGATFKDKDGKMFFGGINGISAFYPLKVDSWKQTMPNIYFSQLTVLNKNINYEESTGKGNILDRHISQARQITLKKSQNVFTIEFAVLEYANPQKVVYSYMLKGFDADWRNTDSKHHSATYTNLPDGRYTFRVKAFFEGSTDEKDVVYKEISIRILPPWYKTWWAYLIYMSLLMAAIWEFCNFLKRKRLRMLERIESERKEMKLSMFTDISHEIRTPLTLVINPLKSMRESETDHKRKEMYNLMYRNSLRILRLINQLMDMRKIDDNKLQMHFNQTDLIFFTQDIMKSFDQLAIMRNIDFRLLSNRETLNVWIDQGNFDKVLFNILSNAFKFTPDNGYMLISVSTFVNNKQSGLSANVSEYVEIHLENSGSFIEEAELERIFDRFYQANDSNSGGSGIGLHLAKKIVNLHHGCIIARNLENGVAFIIRIPLGNNHLSAEEMSVAAKHKDLYSSIRPDEKQPGLAEYIEMPEAADDDLVTKTSKSKKTLVFVDDDVDLGKYVKLELSDKYNVEVFLDGKEAWKVISTTIPDAVVTDLIMPEVDGISLCHKIRQNPATNYLPVIILTSQTDEETEQQCIKSGADSFLTKPISLELLRSTLAQAIQTRDLIRNKFRSNINPAFNEIQMSSPDSRLIANVIETIRKNIENSEFSVDDLSREVGLSRVHLNRKLKENINISPVNLIKSIRLKQAAYLLIKNKVNVSEVAYKVGYSSPSYFSNNFREYFGMVPSEFVVKYMDSDDKEILTKLFEVN